MADDEEDDGGVDDTCGAKDCDRAALWGPFCWKHRMR